MFKIKKDKQSKTDENTKSDFFEASHKFTVQRTGRQIARLQRAIKISAIVVLALLILVLLLYFIFFFFNIETGGNNEDDRGDFTIEVDKDSRELLSICQYSDLKDPQISLPGTSVEDLWHCTRSWIPADVDKASEGGDHSSTDPSYLAYTFYVLNASDKDIKYDYSINFVEKELDIDEAARIMIYRNGDPAVYGKSPNKDGSSLENGTIPFVSNTVYVNETNNSIKYKEADKYTVVIYLEGEDPECVNDILGSKLKVDFVASVSK